MSKLAAAVFVALGAAGIAAPTGDPARFATAPDFMAYLGLVPSERSSGQRPPGQSPVAGSASVPSPRLALGRLTRGPSTFVPAPC